MTTDSRPSRQAPGEITDEAVAALRSPHRHSRAASAAAALPPSPASTRSATSAIAYGDDNPLWCEPDYAAKTRWEGPIASPVLVGGDTLIGEDEVPRVPEEHRELMKGDPLRGVHAFYAASAREWWAPLRPEQRIRRRNALVGVHDKASEFAERAIHEWTGQVFATDDGTLLSGQYRMMARTERTKARERGKYAKVEPQSYTDEQIAEIDAQYVERGPARRRAAVVGGRQRRRSRRPDGQGAAARHRHDLLARRHGHGPVRHQAVAPRRSRAGPDPALLPPRRLQRPRRDAARALGPGVRQARRPADDLRLRPDARDVAHPRLHRLDGRRRLAVEARLRVPGVQLRR